MATRIGQKSAAESAGLPSAGPPPATVVMIAAGCAETRAGDSKRSRARHRPRRRRLMGGSPLRNLEDGSVLSVTFERMGVTTHSQHFCGRRTPSPLVLEEQY